MNTILSTIFVTLIILSGSLAWVLFQDKVSQEVQRRNTNMFSEAYVDERRNLIKETTHEEEEVNISNTIGHHTIIIK